ncbi:MAG: hypothetical protein K8L99_09710 [Anaerolineae bacterium]|nr:hypothetical protein [Anaerolineae bacterium]
MFSLHLAEAVRDGLLLSLALSVVIVVSLYVNPRVWIQDFPEAVRRIAPPLSPVEKRQRAFFGVLFIGTIVGGIIVIALNLRAQLGGSVSFLTLYVYLWLVANIFNLFDAIVLDYLWLGLAQPKFAMPPEMRGMESTLLDKRMNIINYLKGIVFCTILPLPFAFILAL